MTEPWSNVWHRDMPQADGCVTYGTKDSARTRLWSDAGTKRVGLIIDYGRRGRKC
jgi:hypothetical protein